MPMEAWIHKYPGVQRFLTAPDDVLDYAPDRAVDQEEAPVPPSLLWQAFSLHRVALMHWQLAYTWENGISPSCPLAQVKRRRDHIAFTSVVMPPLPEPRMILTLLLLSPQNDILARGIGEEHVRLRGETLRLHFHLYKAPDLPPAFSTPWTTRLLSYVLPPRIRRWL